MTETKTQEKITLKSLTGCPDTVRILSKGIHTRPVEDGFLVWNQHHVFMIEIDDNLRVKLYSEKWLGEKQIYSLLVTNSPIHEYPEKDNERYVTYNSLQSSIEEISEEAACNLLRKQDLSSRALQTQIQKLIYKSLNERLQGIMKEAHASPEAEKG